MWCHIVLFKLKDFPKDEKLAIRNEIKTKLEKLPSLIDELKDLKVGLNVELDSKSFDIALTTFFEKLEDIDTYQVHPEHVKVLEVIKRSITDRAAVDYEL